MSNHYYAQIQEEISQANCEILKMIETSNDNLLLPDIDDIENKKRIARSIYETTNNYGQLSSENWHSFQVSVAGDMLSIHFQIYSNSILGMGQVVLRDKYGCIASSTSFQIFGFSSTAVINAPMQGIYYIDIRVSSSQGGSYSYEFKQNSNNR